MMVGTVIKVTKMKQLYFLIGIFLLLASLFSCLDENDEQRKEEAREVQVDFDTEVGEVPEGLKDWPHVLFVFENEECVEVKESPDDASLLVPSTGDKMVALAYESKANLSLGALSSGVPLASYYVSVEDVNEDIPQVWMGQLKVASNSGNTLTLKPVTSLLKVNFVNAPQAFEAISFALPEMANRVNIYSGDLQATKNSSGRKEVNVGKSETGKEVVIFPMLKPGDWTLACKLILSDGKSVDKKMPVPVGIKNGQSVEVNVDFTDYESEGTCKLTYRYAAYGMTAWTSYSTEITLKEKKEEKEENRYYKVSVQQKDGTWKEVDVHYALCSDGPNHHTAIWNDWNNSKGLRDTMSFVNFTHDFDAPIKIRVQKKKSFGKVEVRPSTYGIVPVSVGNNTIEFTLPNWEKRKISVEFDGDRYHNLMILPNKPDPNRPDPDNLPAGMKYYGPGEHNLEWITLKEGTTEFVGYDYTEYEASILRYRQIKQKNQTLYQIVLDYTPFYAESGGQVGDTGVLVSEFETIEVIDTKKENNLPIHITKKLPEHPEAPFMACVNTDKRAACAANHSATHLLDAALREVLGEHIEQKGSLVTPDSLRFDFSHFQKVTDEEIRQVEHIVNARIRANIPLKEYRNIPIEEAKELGAIALFGEKYGDRVRVIQFGSSIEFCGGTHVAATGNIGMVKIVSESSVAAGVRRIEAYTGARVEEMLDTIQDTLSDLKALFNNTPDLGIAIRKYLEENAGLKKQVEDFMKEKEAALKERLLKNIQEIHGIKVIKFCAPLPAEVVKNIAFQLRGEITENLFFVAGSTDAGKPMLTVMISDNLVAGGLKAGNLVKEAAKLIQGGGGGQPHFATAGGKNPDGLSAAVDKVLELAGL